MSVPTIGQVEARVRAFMKDTREGSFRYSPQTVLGAVFDGLRALQSLRPETRYEGLKPVRRDWPYLTEGSDDNEIEEARAMEWPVDPRWEQAVRYYAAARCFELDAADTVNAARARECQANFSALAAM